MLNISGIHEGFVLDHIKAGMSLQIYHDLKLDELDCTVAIIKNAKSSKMGKKDILKVEDYHNGKEKAIGFLVGQTMKAMKGKANPALVNQILKELL